MPPKSPQTVTSTGDQAFDYLRLWGIFHSILDQVHCPQRPEEGVGSLGAGVLASYKLPDVGVGN